MAKRHLNRPIKTPKKGGKPYRTEYGDAIKAIYKRFIEPLIDGLINSNPETPRVEGLLRFFDVDNRPCLFYKVTKDFSMPGKEWINGHPEVLGYTGQPRAVKKSEGVVVRRSAYSPDQIEIDFNGRVFQITGEEWVRLEKNYLEVRA